MNSGQFNEKLQAKYELIKQNEVDYDEYMTENASIVLVSYGISSRICRSARRPCQKGRNKSRAFQAKNPLPVPGSAVKSPCR